MANKIYAQNNVGIGTSNPDPSAILELNDSKTGFLVTRLTTTQRVAITTPANGLLVYDVTVNCFYYFSTLSGWVSLCPGSGGVGATGPAGVTGLAGNNGLIGLTGPTGINGLTGATGMLGATGPTGVTGNNGTTGATGGNGTNGPAGATGNNGTNGVTGAVGNIGANGVTGATGINGTTGATGATGNNGVTGPTGNNGLTGTTGISIVASQIINDSLFLTFSNNQIINAGFVGDTDGFSHYIGELFQCGIIVDVWKVAGVEHGLIASLTDVATNVTWSNITATLIGATAQNPLTDDVGRIIFELRKAQYTNIVEMSQEAAGVYLLTVYYENLKATFKLIKQD